MLLLLAPAAFSVDYNAQSLVTANVIRTNDFIAGFTNQAFPRKWAFQTILNSVSGSISVTQSVVAAGANITVTTNTSGTTVKYTISGTSTNGFATTNYVNVATNDLSAVLVTRITAATNDTQTTLKTYSDAATNALSGVLVARITSATQDVSTVLNSNITAATQALSSVTVPTSRTITIDGTEQDLSANRTYSSAPAIANVVTPGTIVTQGFSPAMVFSNSVTFRDAANAQMVVSNGVIGSVKAITNSGNIASATYSSSGKATFNNINCAGDLTFSGVNFFTIPSDTIGKIGRDFTSLWLVPPVNVQGVASFTNGVASYRSNAIAPTSITAPLTTVNWTNTINVNIQVYIDNSGVTGTAIKKNGTQIFSSLVGDVTLGLQPGEYMSLTYTLGTPVITWSPF